MPMLMTLYALSGLRLIAEIVYHVVVHCWISQNEIALSNESKQIQYKSNKKCMDSNKKCMNSTFRWYCDAY